MVGGLVVFGFLRGQKQQPALSALSRSGTAAEREALILRHGYNGMSFLTLYPGWEYFHPPEGEGFIAFERHNKTALVCGDPVCAEEDVPSLSESFRAYCAAERLTPAFVGTTNRFAESCHGAGWKTLKIGEEPLFDLEHYAPRGYSAKKMRSDAKRAARDGLKIEVVPAGTLPSAPVSREILEVQRAWQTTRKISPLSFTLRLAPLAFAEHKLLIIARLNGRIEGFVSGIPVPARNGYYLEAMIRRPDAKGGTSESLFLAAIDECRARGIGMVATGLAPLRNARSQPDGHRLIGHLLQLMFLRLNFFYKFRPLEHFKAKFAPTEWEESFIVYRPRRLARVGVAVLGAFTPGRFGVVRAMVSRFRRPAREGARRFSPGNVAGMAASASVALIYSAVAVQHPALFAPVDFSARVLLFPVKELGEAARAHLIIDSIIAAGAGGWYVRSARGDGE